MNKAEINPNKCLICGRPTHKESKYCIFHAFEKEKTEEEFKQALKEYVNKIKEEDGDYDFKKFIFVGHINFKKDLNINIFKNACFSGATFQGMVFFLETCFKGKADFIWTVFKGNAYFTSEPFKGEVNFLRANFKGKAEFTGATFKGNADFTSTIFKGNTYFTFATFEGEANFTEAIFEVSTEFKGTTFKGNSSFEDVSFKGHTTYFVNATFERDANFFVVKFKGNANFTGITFNGDANFEEATFKGDADFRLKYFIKILKLSKIHTLTGKKLFIKSNNKEGKISFERANLENIYLDIDLVEGISIDFTDALLRNTKMEKDKIENHILQEKDYKFPKAQEIYLLLKNNFHSIGRYNDESWAFTKEKDMERMRKSFYSFLSKYKKYSLFRKILKHSNLLKRVVIESKIFSKWFFSKEAREWVNLSSSNIIYQYGESPRHVIRNAFWTIFIFAILLKFSGIVYSDRTNMIIEFIKESQNGGYVIRYLGPILGDFLNCIYFSVVTFTTLGYGDFQPAVGLSKFFVSLEAIIGAFTMALYAYTLGRKRGGNK